MHTARQKLLRLFAVAICLAWLGSFAYLLPHGRYLFFLARNYWVLLAFGIVAFGAFAVAVGLRGLPSSHFGRGRMPWVSLAVCVLPLAFLAANPRPVPSSYALAVRAGFKRMWESHIALGLRGRSSLQTGLPAATSPAAPDVPASRPAGPDETPARQATTLDLLMKYPGNVGQRVVTEGMVYRTSDLANDRTVVFRFVITCCAADAIPAAVLVTSDDAGTFPIDSWVRVRGLVERTEFKGLNVPIIRAEQIVPIPQPRNPYID